MFGPVPNCSSDLEADVGKLVAQVDSLAHISGKVALVP